MNCTVFALDGRKLCNVSRHSVLMYLFFIMHGTVTLRLSLHPPNKH